MAYTPLKVHIPTPCHEDWNGMSPVSGTTERHCASCVKNVVDFTSFTDTQLHAYFRAQPGKLCGRFRPDQINRPIRSAGDRRSHPLRIAAAAAGLMLAGAGCAAKSETSGISEAARATPEQVTHPDVPTTGYFTLAAAKQPAPPDNVPPTPPPTVGEITLQKPAASLQENPNLPEDEVDFIVGDIDIHEPVIEEPIAISSQLIPPPPPPAKHSDHTAGGLMGLVIIDPPAPTGIDLILDTIKSVLPPDTAPRVEKTQHPRPRPHNPPHLDNLTVFPNPFVDLINVEIDVPEATTLTVQMIDVSGRQVTRDRWEALPGYNVFLLRPPQSRLKGGSYFLRITDDAGNSISRSIIRQ